MKARSRPSARFGRCKYKSHRTLGIQPDYAPRSKEVEESGSPPRSSPSKPPLAGFFWQQILSSTQCFGDSGTVGRSQQFVLTAGPPTTAPMTPPILNWLLLVADLLWAFVANLGCAIVWLLLYRSRPGSRQSDSVLLPAGRRRDRPWKVATDEALAQRTLVQEILHDFNYCRIMSQPDRPHRARPTRPHEAIRQAEDEAFSWLADWLRSRCISKFARGGLPEPHHP